MPDRYNNGHGSDRNTDNEETMFIPKENTSYSGRPQQTVPPLKRANIPNNHPQQNYGQPAPQNSGYYYAQNDPRSNRPDTYAQRQQNGYSDYNQIPNGNPQQNIPARPPQNPYENNQQGVQRRPYQPDRQRRENVPQQPSGNQRKPQPSTPKQNKPQKKKHNNPLGAFIRRVFFTLLILFLLIFGIYSCTALSLIGKVNKEETGSRYRTSGAMSESYVKSVLLIGTDGRTNDESSRSDTMILLSLNSKTQEIIMTSFMRDCYVEIPNKGWDKLNAAYVYGGPDLVMDTIEYNFNVKIDDYVTINFNSFASIIDSIGGIDIDMTGEEAQAVNDVLISEVNELMGDDRMDDLLSGGGKLHLNGKQALSYARIRYVSGGNDFERTQRQRTVVAEVIKKAKSFNPKMLSSIASDVMPKVSTNMTTQEMYFLSLRLPFNLRYDTKQVRIPADNTYSYGTAYLYGGEQSVLQVDFDKNQEIIESEVFSDEK